MPRILLLLPNTSYRTDDFLAAARRLGVDVTVATDQASTLEALSPEGLLTLDFTDAEAAAPAAGRFAARTPVDAVLGVDDETAEVAAVIAGRLGLRHNSVASARAARDKSLSRAALARAGVPVPWFRVWPLAAPLSDVAAAVPFPCVIKPLFLSGSRGVIRADDPAGLASAWRRLGRLMAQPAIRRHGQEKAASCLVEQFIPGAEVALEGMLEDGELTVLALFDKPDPLDGPFFEETIYVTPSRLPEPVQTAVAACAQQAARALGLVHGPVHAELRVNENGPWILEVAARSIGGRCSRALRFGDGVSLEEVIVRQALGLPWRDLPRDTGAAGVMMLPIPRGGVLREYRGLAEARAVPGIESVAISLRRGARVVPLPEGASYLGFAFARSASPEAVEAALRAAYACLAFDIEPSGLSELSEPSEPSELPEPSELSEPSQRAGPAGSAVPGVRTPSSAG